MSVALPEGAMRVQGELDRIGSGLRVEMLPESTATAEDAARAVGVTAREIGKSIVFTDGERAIVAIVPGDRRVSVARLATNTNCNSLKRPDAEMVYKLTGFRIGGVSPFALPTTTLLVMDSRLMDLDALYVAAGHPRAVTRIRGRELLTLSRAVLADISD